MNKQLKAKITDTGMNASFGAHVSEVYSCDGLGAFNSSEYTVVPGFCDVHVHFRQPGFSYKETIESGSKAAARGGYTAVFTMPNLNPVPHNCKNLQVQLDAIKKDAVINVYPFGAVTVNEEDKELADYQSMKDHIYGLSDDGRGVNSLDLLEQAMIFAKENNFTIASHAEDNFYKYSREVE